MSTLLNRTYTKIFNKLCGTPPQLSILHYQWHAARELTRDLLEVLPRCRGRMLDYGCGSSPYKPFMPNINEYVGADINPDSNPDILITENAPLPETMGEFDSILCTQVLEHVRDYHKVLKTLSTSLHAGGTLIISVPFIYNIHDAPHDFRRFSQFGIVEALGEDFTIVDIRKQGAVGSTISILFLNWIHTALNENRAIRIIKGLLLPLTITLSLTVNTLGFFLDKIDKTDSLYNNLLVVAQKR